MIYAVSAVDPKKGKAGKWPTDSVPSEYEDESTRWGDPVSIHQAARYTYAQAYEHLTKLAPAGRVERFLMGYLPRPDSALVVGDMDNCRDVTTGDLHPWAQDILKAGPTYAEVSTSGNGIRLLMERQPGDDDQPHTEANDAGLFADGKIGAVLTFQRLPNHEVRPVASEDVKAALLARRGPMTPKSERAPSDIKDRPEPWLLQEVVKLIPNDDLDYDTWRNVGLAICHSVPDDVGGPVFDDFSKKSAKYDPDFTLKFWRALPREGELSFGTLVWMAREASGSRMPDKLELEIDKRRLQRHVDNMPILGAPVAINGPTAWDDCPEWPDAPYANPDPWFNVSDLDGQTPPKREWIVPEWVPKKTVTMLGGDGGTGKSLLALQLAMSVATNTKWVGLDVEAGSTVYISAEDDKDELHRRLVSVANGYGLPMSDVAAMRVLSLAGKDAVLGSFGKLDNLMILTQVAERIRIEIACVKPTLVVLDTLADLFGGNENDRAQARQFIGLLRGIAIDFDCAVVLLAHPSKSGMGEGGDGTSGSTGWNNSVRSRLYLDRVVDSDDLRTVKRMKANYASSDGEMAIRWVDGHFVRLIGDNVVADVEKLAKWENVFLKLLDEFTEQGRPARPHKGHGYAPAEFEDHPEAEKITKKQFTKAMNSLLSKKLIAIETIGPEYRRSSTLCRT